MEKGISKLQDENRILRKDFQDLIQEKEKINSNLNETLDVILAMEEKLQKANVMLKESDKLLEQSTQNN